ncbi:MAG: hypothetical protein GXP18_08550 [Gammaproteobacteria bacterium]|nr:hypothetical protein [Gammaproteobacteria bacterium]
MRRLLLKKKAKKACKNRLSSYLYLLNIWEQEILEKNIEKGVHGGEAE